MDTIISILVDFQYIAYLNVVENNSVAISLMLRLKNWLDYTVLAFI